jgi:hypothetical protein
MNRVRRLSKRPAAAPALLLLASAAVLGACGDDDRASGPDVLAVQPQTLRSDLNYPTYLTVLDQALGSLPAGTVLVAQAGTTGAGQGSILAIAPDGSARTVADATTLAAGGRRAVSRPEGMDAEGPFIAIANFADALGSVAFLEPDGRPAGGVISQGLLDARNFGFTVTSSQPEAGQTVGLGQITATVFLSAPVDPATVRSNRFYLDRVGSSDDPTGTIEIAPDGRSMRFIPDRGLMPATDYRIRVLTSIKDVHGNNLDADPFTPKRQSFDARFRVGGNLPNLTVETITPLDRETGVPLRSSVIARFTVQVVAATVNAESFFVTAASARVPGTITLSDDRFVATFTPAGDYAIQTVHTVTLTTDIRDNFGRQLDASPGGQPQPFTSTFTTAGGVDTTPPRVVSVDPPDGGQAPPSAIVTVSFSEPVDPATLTASSVRLELGGQPVAGTVRAAASNQQAVFTPGSALQSGQQYAVVVTTDVRDRSGNQLDQVPGGGPDPFRSTFTVRGTPVVINEVVTDPQRDWNDTRGGNGVPFDAEPGTDTPTSRDEWIELFNTSGQTQNITGWRVLMQDNSPATHVIGSPPANSFEVYSSGSTAASFRAGAFLVIGNPGGDNAEMSNDVFVVLSDSAGNIIDDVEIGDDPEGDGRGDGAPDPGVNGNANSAADEAIARRPNGRDTNDDIRDFVKQRATIGSTNDAVHPSNLPALPGVDGGVTDVVYAGPAPDGGGALSQLYLLASSNNEAILAVDLDDEVYQVSEFFNPRALVYHPGGSAGSGTLFVLHGSGSGGDSGITRMKIVPTGPLGNAATRVRLSDAPGGVIALVSAQFREPVAMAYDAPGELLYVANRGDGSILEIDVSGPMQILRRFETGLPADQLSAAAFAVRGGARGLYLAQTVGGIDSGPVGRLSFLTLP